MQRRDNLTHFILVGVIAVVLTPLMIVVAAQARITFMSDRDGHVHPRLGWPTFEIYVMDVDGNNQRRLTNNPNLDRHPSWSPDGKRIAFISDRDGHVDILGGLLNYEIYVMDADGGNPQNLTNDPNDDSLPSWSPDGERIVFASDRDGNRDGNRENYEIYVMDADGNNQRRLTNNRVDDASPSWSPDGKRIIFTSQRDGHVHPILGWPTSEIYVMDADGKNARRLTNNPHYDSNPEWVHSPFSVFPVGKKFTVWGWLKQLNR